jgi:hypothetical protein
MEKKTGKIAKAPEVGFFILPTDSGPQPSSACTLRSLHFHRRGFPNHPTIDKKLNGQRSSLSIK